MKTLLLIFFFCIGSSLYAQMQPGMQRGNGMGMGMQPPPSTTKPKKVDIIEEATKEITKAVQLDDFQSAIVKGYLQELKAKADVIMEEDAPNEGKAEKIQTEKLKFETKVKAILTPPQLELFEKYQKKKEKKR